MINCRNLVQFIGYEGPMHMNEDQFRAFWNPLSDAYMKEGGISKVILSQVLWFGGILVFPVLKTNYISTLPAMSTNN